MITTVIGNGPASIELAKALKCRRNNPNAEFAIGWGLKRSDIFQLGNFDRVLNTPDQIKRSGNKFKALQTMRNAGIPVPDYSEYKADLDYPMLGRKFNHTQGQDILFLEENRPTGDSEYYVEFIPVKKERRYHVLYDTVIAATYKFGGEREGKGAYCRNYKTGWKFSTYTPEPKISALAIAAVKALNLAFGAVDIIIGEDNKPYVLEVNTAPGLIPVRAEEYAKAFKAWSEGTLEASEQDSQHIRIVDPMVAYLGRSEEPQLRDYQFTTRVYNYYRTIARSRDEAWDNFNRGLDVFQTDSDDEWDTEIETIS